MTRRDKPSYIPLFPDSYLADTTHLSTEQHGAYILLLMAAWRSADCALVHDEKRLADLAQVTVAKWRKIGPTIMEMWTCEGGRCWQKRLRHEWLYVNQTRAKRRDAANARWGANADANAFQMQCTIGGGVGVGSNTSLIQEEGSEGSLSHAREAGPFTVIRGGGK